MSCCNSSTASAQGCLWWIHGAVVVVVALALIIEERTLVSRNVELRRIIFFYSSEMTNNICKYENCCFLFDFRNTLMY
jgi:hypothetical protein